MKLLLRMKMESYETKFVSIKVENETESLLWLEDKQNRKNQAKGHEIKTELHVASVYPSDTKDLKEKVRLNEKSSHTRSKPDMFSSDEEDEDAATVVMQAMEIVKAALGPKVAVEESPSCLKDSHTGLSVLEHMKSETSKLLLKTTKKVKSKQEVSEVMKKRLSRKPKAKRKSCQPQKLWCLDLVEDARSRWHKIGRNHGLSSDTQIASFLIKHYEATIQTSKCGTCNSTLTLVCEKCGHHPVSASEAQNISRSHASSPSLSMPSAEEDREEMEIPIDEEGCQNSLHVEPKPSVDSPPKLKRRGKRQPYKCRECGSLFSRSGGLKVHMRIHTGEKPYKCQQCGEAFSQSGQLTAHIRKHTGERPYICGECGSSFPLSGSLKQHMRIHTGEKPFSCKDCGKQFSYAGDLTVHIRKHTGDKPFLCQDCGKAFAVSSDLTKHKKIHTGDRPFPCSQCGKAFPFLNRLTAHMRTHTGDKPFLCQECGAAFSRASNLTVHKRTHHTGEKPFKCPECGVAFSDSANLSKHKKNKHPKDFKVLPKVPLSLMPTASTQQPCPAHNASSSFKSGTTDDLSLSSGTLPSSGPSIFPFYNYCYPYQHQTAQHYLEHSSGSA